MILYFSQSKRNVRSVGEYTAAIEALILSGNCEKAVTDSTEALAHYPESAELYILRSRAYLLSGDPAKAVGTLDYGYKRTQSRVIADKRSELTESLIEDAEFLPLTKPENAAGADTSTPSAVSTGGADTAGTSVETYRPDTPIKVTIPEVTPPPPPVQSEPLNSD